MQLMKLLRRNIYQPHINGGIKNRFMSIECENSKKCNPKPACDVYKPCPPSPCPKSPPKCIPDCSLTGEEGGHEKIYRNLSLFVLTPILILTAIGVYMKIEEEDLKPRAEFVPYSYMYVRNKRFPWGDGNHSFFHNPIKNAVPPDGYESEDPNAVEKIDEEDEGEG